MAPTQPTHPVARRVAVIDIGTNSTRLMVADVVDSRISVVERRSTVTRLGRGVDHSRQLSSEGIEAVCETIADYLRLVGDLAAEEILVIATSAVRDAANGSAFVAELRERFDLNAQVIDGDEEARLTYLGCTSERDSDERLVVIDVGGGSTELVIGKGPDPLFHTSLQAGVVRHTERMLASDPPTASELEELSSDIHKLVTQALKDQDLSEIDAAVAVAGTSTSLASVDLELDPYDPLAVEGYLLPMTVIQHWLSQLASMELEKRKQVVGLHPDRASAIVAGMVILIEVMRAFSLKEIEVS
ncbi:MAG: Ppx/GppA family phosphatase, partial [Acidobacteriota bacterium]